MKYHVAYYIEKDFGWHKQYQRGSCNWTSIYCELLTFLEYHCPSSSICIETEEIALNYLNRQIRNRSLKWYDEIRV